MTRGAERPEDPRHQGVLLVAGLAELAVSTLGSALGTVRGLLRRSDTAELVAEAEQDLIARGRLVLDQYAAAPPAHLEVLARHAMARQADDGV
ncbi:polyprenyl synthetase [Streptomyces sp. NPDC006335]|uniref:polyprenyl synthetase n=1 Tax=Streptomyces sp. NPDC006335 TaxID=3156895 RepID=UPI0033A231A0